MQILIRRHNKICVTGTCMRTLVVVAHLDDESFGMGGTLSKMCQEKPDDVYILSLCKGRKGQTGEREQSFFDVITELGCMGIYCDYYDLTLDNIPLNEIADIISDRIIKFKPERVICNSIDDIHQDHVMVSKATRISCRPFNQSTVKSLYEFKIPGSSQGEFNVVSDISEYVTKKLDLCELYESEIKDGIHPCSPNGIIGINYADGVNFGVSASELLRVVWSCEF